MLKQHARRSNYPYPFHQPGEVVLATYGNFLETRGTDSTKPRPAILLRVSDCQHCFAGLTTQSHYLTSGDARPVIPKSPILGLDRRRSHLWSPRPAFITRMDIRRHLGWIDHEVVEFLAAHMQLDRMTLSILWRAASIHAHETRPRPR